MQKRVVFKHRIWRPFPLFLGAFWSPKIVKNHNFSKKLMSGGVLWSTIALELLFGWILSPSEFNFERFLSLRNLFLESRIAFGETCVRRFRLKNLLWWLGRRGAHQLKIGSIDWRLWEPKMDAKSNVSGVFFAVLFLNAFLCRFLFDFLKLQTKRKLAIRQWIFAKSTFWIRQRKNLDFGWLFEDSSQKDLIKLCLPKCSFFD